MYCKLFLDHIYIYIYIYSYVYALVKLKEYESVKNNSEVYSDLPKLSPFALKQNIYSNQHKHKIIYRNTVIIITFMIVQCHV